MTIKKILPILLFCLLTLQFQTVSGRPKCIRVKGGEMKISDQVLKIESFRITQYEITNGQYASFLNHQKVKPDGRCKERQIINTSSPDLQLEYIDQSWISKQGKENYPMVMVNYYGALEYCKWIGGQLPDEYQWTYAAKGGCKSKNYTYAGGNNLEELGWFKGNCEGHSHEVGKKKPNELGIFDMSGNAWEWCRNDSLKSDTDFCLHMGGSWFPGEQPSQISAHYGNTPTHFSNSVGFRVIMVND